jgi:hypothetical protein
MLMIQKQHTKIDKNKYTKNNPNLPKHYTAQLKKKKKMIFVLLRNLAYKYFGAVFL